jgi:fused signal recognition particle receptor
VLVVGVNGVGKTTTVAKLATKYMAQGKKVLAIAADTFRAAAVEQLAEWSSRVGFTLVRGAEEAKPSAVVFDGMKSALEGGYDVVLIDTAGRLHTKSNLMQELEGIRNVIRKHVPDGPHETILVLDGVSGQNALSQAREFNSAVSLSGLVVTKLDGTPKGGIIIAISQELHLPVFFIGVGEKVDDLVPFDKRVFVEALFKERPQASAVLESKPQAQVGNT